MKFSQAGIILCTKHYRPCVSFCSEALKLPIMFSLDNEHSHLMCCGMGMQSLKNRELASSTIRRKLSAISSLFNYLCEQKK